MRQVPLPEDIRPKNFKSFVGQKHLVGKEGVITKLVKSAKRTGFFPSIIFWGPPGSGKTTLTRIIADKLDRKFFEFSAVNTSVKDIEKVISEIQEASEQMELMKKGKSKQNKMGAPIIFLDEIHRFNKAQQDKLLPFVEKGIIVLIGATTENPSFEVIGPLLSRSRVLTLEQLNEDQLRKILERAIEKTNIKPNKKARDFLIDSSNGDARVLLNVFEIASNLTKEKKLTISDMETALQREQYSFDKKGEEYYNTISAFIKSMRASQPNAALYYLARMVEAGQDPLYIARRMVIFASEDIGMAQPTALVVANEVFKACETIGYPECAINLAHGAVYLSKAKKDRSSYEGYFSAVDDVKKHGNLPVPMEIRNAPTKLMEGLGYGKNYQKYTKKDLLPKKLRGKKYYKEK
jgi:putative ATPase